jgi:hypothetical protein
VTSSELAELGRLITNGEARNPKELTYDQFLALDELVLKTVDPDRCQVVVALVEGRALATFPDLSPQILRIRGNADLTEADFGLPSRAGVRVYGARRKGSRQFLLSDLRDYWWLVASLLLIAAALWQLDAGIAVARAIGGILSVVAGLFLTVFVLFGVGEVVRASGLQLRVFRTGQLQRYLDADRYLVRLAVSAFALSSVAVVLGEIGDQLAKAIESLGVSPVLSTHSVELAALAATWLGLTASLLCLRATTGYLVDRAAGVALMDAANRALAEDPSDL